MLIIYRRKERPTVQNGVSTSNFSGRGRIPYGNRVDL